jgi:hypothetical protein
LPPSLAARKEHTVQPLLRTIVLIAAGTSFAACSQGPSGAPAPSAPSSSSGAGAGAASGSASGSPTTDGSGSPAGTGTAPPQEDTGAPPVDMPDAGTSDDAATSPGVTDAAGDDTAAPPGTGEGDASTFTLGGGNPNSMGLDRHDALYCGEWQKTNPVGDTIYLIKGGKVVWTHSLPTAGQDEFGDCWITSNGHVFFNRKQYGAQEIVPDMTTGKEGQIVWEYKEDPGTEVHSVQPIGLDKALVMQNGLPVAKLMLIDKTKAMSCTSGAPCVLQTWTIMNAGGAVHGLFRHVRMLKNGNLLVPYTEGGKVIEYTQQGFMNVWEYDIPGGSPWAAVRLHNGNTIVSGNGGGWVREITPAKQVVWQIDSTMFPVPLHTMQNTMRLVNGNTIINNWCPGGPNALTATAAWPMCVQVMEVTPMMQIVWKVQSWTMPNLGPGSSTQLLDQPGIPENPGDLQY